MKALKEKGMEKKQFRIGELAKHVGVKRFVIRFWEKEFNLSPHRSTGGQRFYIDNDLKLFQQIKTLLYDRGFTIAGAKQHIQNPSKAKQFLASKKIPSEPSSTEIPTLEPEFYNQLLAVKNKLEKLQLLLSKQ